MLRSWPPPVRQLRVVPIRALLSPRWRISTHSMFADRCLDDV